MAGRIQGITVEIGGDTTKLQTALKGVNKVGAAVSSVADKIRSFLNFSVPDEGPLTDYESWIPGHGDNEHRKHARCTLTGIR